jgi:gliding motility-associated-like protein
MYKNLKIVLALFIMNASWCQQLGCVGMSHQYTVDTLENNGLGTPGSIYQWVVLSTQFQGTIELLSASGNTAVVHWGTTPMGNYSLQVTEIDNIGCTNVITLNVVLNNFVTIDLQNVFLCTNPTTNQILPQTISTNLSTNQYSHTWMLENNPISQTNQITVVQEGTYTLLLTHLVTGCTRQYSFVATTVSSMSSQYTLKNDFDFQQLLELTTAGGLPPYQYSINNGAFQNESSFILNTAGTYTVKVKDETGCFSNYLQVDVFMYPPFFTPNGDGFNDYWTISTPQDLKKAEITIFDRYGKLIFNFKSNGAGWDGKLNGYELPATDYWFVIDYINRNGETKQFKSHFSLKR